MVTIKIDVSKIKNDITAKFNQLADKEYLLRPVAFDVIKLMTERIHERGEASDGSQIGTYSPSYLKLREKKYNRSSDKKIIVSLTRQLENDWSVIATQRGYGIGFLNSFNREKAGFVEEQKGKRIFKLSADELQFALNEIDELTIKALQ
jgi:hypothetical protein